MNTHRQKRTNMDSAYYAQDTEFGYGNNHYLPCRSGAAREKAIWFIQ